MLIELAKRLNCCFVLSASADTWLHVHSRSPASPFQSAVFQLGFHVPVRWLLHRSNCCDGSTVVQRELQLRLSAKPEGRGDIPHAFLVDRETSRALIAPLFRFRSMSRSSSPATSTRTAVRSPPQSSSHSADRSTAFALLHPGTCIVRRGSNTRVCTDSRGIAATGTCSRESCSRGCH